MIIYLVSAYCVRDKVIRFFYRKRNKCECSKLINEMLSRPVYLFTSEKNNCYRHAKIVNKKVTTNHQDISEKKNEGRK